MNRLLARLRHVGAVAVDEWRRLRAADDPWDRVAALVTTRPGSVLLVTLSLLALPLFALPTLDLDHDTLAQLPRDAESVQGMRALADRIPPGDLEPIVLLVETDDTEVWEPDVFHALGLMSENLLLVDGVDSVRSAAMPTGGEPLDGDGADPAGEVDDLADGLAEASDGAYEIADGVDELLTGLVEMERRVPELAEGLDEARDGTGQLRSGAVEAHEGAGELRAAAGELRAALGELRGGLTEARDGTDDLRSRVAAPSEEHVRRGFDALQQMSVGRLDPMYGEVGTEFGEVYARLTGEYPPGHGRSGERIDPDYRGLTASLAEIVDGLDAAVAGVSELGGAVAELERALTELHDGLGRLAAGSDELERGVGAAAAGTHELADAASQMRAGVEDELLPGVIEVAEELDDAATETSRVDLGAVLGSDGPGPAVLTAGMVDGDPELRRDLDFFVADGGGLTRVFIGTGAASYTDEAMATVGRIVDVAEMSLRGADVEDVRILQTGPAAFLSQMDEIATADFWLIAVAVVIGIVVVLAVLLRSVVAPVYMAASVIFSYFVALGMGTFVFQHVLGHDGLAWYLPVFLFVLLVALGIDYSIFLMSRVREEADRRPTTAAVAAGVRLTGHVITSAGIILAGTFGALMIAPLTPLAQIGFTVAFGVIIDTFVVRTFVVPSAAVLLGRWNWWPSRRFHAEPGDRTHHTVRPREQRPDRAHGGRRTAPRALVTPDGEELP